MPGVRKLRSIRLGKETVAGTAVAATTRFRGRGTIEDALVMNWPEEDVGILGGMDRNNISALGTKMQMQGVASYEQLGYIFNAGIIGAAGVADGAGTGFVYTHPWPTSTQGSHFTYTIEGGDDQQAEEMEFSHVEDFQLTSESSQDLKLTANWFGRQATPTTFTAGATIPDPIEDILFNLGKLFIDDVSGSTVGTTQKTNTFLKFDLKCKTGLRPVWTADGQLYFSLVKRTEPEILMDVTFEHDGTSVTEKAKWRARTARAIRVQFEGSLLGTPGAFTNKTLRLDMWGKWEKFDKIDEINGNDVVKGTFRCRYNATAAKQSDFVIVNSLAALP